MTRSDRILVWGGLGAMVLGSALGLFVAPAELHMGDVYRIMFVHVPAAWVGMCAATLSSVAGLIYLLTSSARADRVAALGAELCWIMTVVVLASGAVWGRPTWGIWWSWDPRTSSLTALGVLFTLYGILRWLLRAPSRRATWTAALAIASWALVPVVWFSVRWFPSLHQVPSTPLTLHPMILFTLAFNGAAFLLFFVGLLRIGARVTTEP